MSLTASINTPYRLKQSEFTKKAWQRGVYDALRIPNETRRCKNNKYFHDFQVKPHYKKIYCSSRCAAIINNSKRSKGFYFCLICNKQLIRSDRKYCSIKCQHTHVYNLYIGRWKKGLEQGIKGINTRVLSGHIEHYLKEKYKDKCSLCSWNQKNPVTGRVPLEIDHIDGDSENNKEENLRLICPNCHSLTPSFRNLNKGKGRAWRMKYLKSINYLEN